MRKKFLQLCKKLTYRFGRFYTWLLRSSLKSCGQDVRLDFPVRLDQPGSISLGAGTIIYPRTWISAVSDWAGVKYGGEVWIGNRVMISYGVQISAASFVVIEDDVTIASGVVIVDHVHDHRHIDVPVFAAPLSKPSPIRIGKSSFLGVHSLIGPGVQIGEHAVVAANAVVTKDVPPYCIAAGNPARVMTRFHNPETNNLPSNELSGSERG